MLFAHSLWIIFKELHDGSLTIQSSEIAQSVRIICAKLFRMHTHLSRKLNKVVLFFGTRGLKRQNFISFASFRSVCLAKQNQRNTQNNINNKNVYICVLVYGSGIKQHFIWWIIWIESVISRRHRGWQYNAITFWRYISRQSSWSVCWRTRGKGVGKHSSAIKVLARTTTGISCWNYLQSKRCHRILDVAGGTG